MRRVLVSLLVLVFAFFSYSTVNVSAKVITNNQGNVTVAKTEVINDDLFIGAQTVEIAGTVNGNVFVVAQVVKISGIINGSLHVGANTLDLSGTVTNNVYSGAQNILVSGASIGDSLLVGAATVNIDRNTIIGGSVLAGTGSLNIDSQVKRSVYAGAGNLTIGSDARIGKDFYYALGNNGGQANISPDAKITGSTYKSEVKTVQKPANVETVKKQIPAVLNGLKFTAEVVSFLGALIVGFLYSRMFGKHLTQTAGLVSHSFWKTLGVGFIVTLALVPGLVILAFTVIGIPLAGLALLVFLLYWYLAKIVVGLAVGNWAAQKFNWKMSPYRTFAVGLLLIYVLKMIPFVGFLTGLAVLWVGLGALALHLFTKTESSSVSD